MPERNDPGFGRGAPGAPHTEEAATLTVSKEGVLQDYVMLDFVDAFVEQAEQPASGT